MFLDEKVRGNIARKSYVRAESYKEHACCQTGSLMLLSNLGVK